MNRERHKVMAALAEAKNATQAATTEEADASNQKLKATEGRDRVKEYESKLRYQFD